MVSASTPPSQLTTVTAAKTDASYAKASSLAQQNISQVRTVVAYNGEELALKEYEAALQEPVKVWGGRGLIHGVLPYTVT